MEQHEDHLCDTTYLDQIYDLKEKLYIVTEEKCALQETNKRLKDKLIDYALEYTEAEEYIAEIEDLKQSLNEVIAERSKAENELYESKKANSELKDNVKKLEHYRECYIELAEKKERHDKAFIYTIYRGIPISTLILLVFAFLGNYAKPINNILGKFLEFVDGFGNVVVMSLISYICLRIYFWHKDDVKK